jgi:cytochrome c oxidase subunit III
VPTVPARKVLQQGELLLYLFLASLAVFFIGGIAAFLLVRFGQGAAATVQSSKVPLGLWLATVILLAGSASLQFALRAVRRERQRAFRQALVAAACLGACFLVIQGISLAELLAQHFRVVGTGHSFGLLFALIMLHALHFLGGLAVLAWVVRDGLNGRFDHEYHHGVKLCTIYWHFLDVVWLVMFVTFLFTA